MTEHGARTPRETRARVARLLGVIATAALLAATATATASPATAGAEPDRSLPKLAAAGTLGIGPRWGQASTRAPADGSTGFLYRNGRFAALNGVPGAALTAHVGINDRGDIVGSYVADADGGIVHGFLQGHDGRVETVDVPDAAATLAFDVNNRGEISGTWADAQGTTHGFLRSAQGQFQSLDVPGAARTVGFGLNDRGQVVGSWVDAQGKERGFVWQRGRFTTTTVQVPGAANTSLGAINNRGQAVGAYDEAGKNPDGKYPPGTYHGLIWDHGTLTRLDVPGSALTGALGINDAGGISGGYADPTGSQHGFLFRAGRFTAFDAPATGNTNGFGIDNRGDVVVPDPASGTGLAGISETPAER